MKLKTCLILILIVLLSACVRADSQLMPTDEALAVLATLPPAEADELAWHEIPFDNLAPDGIQLKQCWNGMGMDDSGRVYIGFTSLRDDGREDFVLYRYDPVTDERYFLGTLIDLAEEAGNLAEGESIPKGHTRIIYADGKMYLATQGFHDFKESIDDLGNYRGSHIFAYDIASDTWEDLAAAQPDGVFTEHQGIVGLNILREEHLLVGLAHPLSDIVLYDYENRELVEVASGIRWALGNPLSREIIVAPSGNIYTYRGTEDPKDRLQGHKVWVYNIHDKTMQETSTVMTNGFWIGQAETRDGSTIYVSTVNGQLYRFDTDSETFTDLGYMLPANEIEEGRTIVYQYGPTLSPDEKTLYFIPSVLDNPDGSGRLYAYDIESAAFYFVQQLPAGIYTSADLRDDSHVYFAHFGNQMNLWENNVQLMVIEVPSEP